MQFLGHLTTLLLVIESILGLALLIDALRAWLNRSVILAPLRSLLKSLQKSQPGQSEFKHPQRSAADHRSETPDLLQRAVETLRNCGPQLLQQAQTDVDRWISSLDGGTSQLTSFLIKTAPQLGLAGTLAGISLSMNKFQSQSADTSVVIQGFAVALSTTLFGIGVACCGIAARRLHDRLRQHGEDIWGDVEYRLLRAWHSSTSNGQTAGMAQMAQPL